MAVTTKDDRKRAFDYGDGRQSRPFPDGVITAVERAHIQGSYIAGKFDVTSFFIPNHVAEALALLIEQFKRSDNLKALITVFATQVQDLENATNQLLIFRSLDRASGEQLDGLGDIVGIARGGRSDESYRDAINTKIILNTSHGEPERLLTGLRFFTGGTFVRIIEYYPASAALFTNGVITSTLQKQMEAIAPAGVNLDIVVAPETTTVFSFATESIFMLPSFALGFNEANFTEGGNEVGGQISEGIS